MTFDEFEKSINREIFKDRIPVSEKIHAIRESYSPQWLVRLAGVVSKHFNCRILLHTRPPKSIKFIGAASDIAVAEYVFVYLRRSVERIAEKTPTPRGENGKRWKEGFRRGVVCGIEGNLSAQRHNYEQSASRETQAKNGDLIVIKRDAVKTYIKEKYPKLGTHRSSSGTDWGSFNDGLAKGKNISVNPAINQHRGVLAVA